MALCKLHLILDQCDWKSEFLAIFMKIFHIEFQWKPFWGYKKVYNHDLRKLEFITEKYGWK
jgi:hypothetical protein